jgi:hypothetical protein
MKRSFPDFSKILLLDTRRLLCKRSGSQCFFPLPRQKKSNSNKEKDPDKQCESGITKIKKMIEFK